MKEDRKGCKHEAAAGYSWVPARTIIDKIELRAAEHRDSCRPVGSAPASRRLSLSESDNHRRPSGLDI